MKAPETRFRFGSLAVSAVLLAALMPLQQVSAITIVDGTTSARLDDTAETVDVFMDSWTVNGEDIYVGVDRGQGFWLHGYTDTRVLGGGITPLVTHPTVGDSHVRELNQNRLTDDVPLAGDGTGNGTVTYGAGNMDIAVSYAIADLGGGMASITEIYDITVTGFIVDTVVDFYVWSNAALGTGANTGAFNAARDLYTQTDGTGRSFTMSSSIDATGLGAGSTVVQTEGIAAFNTMLGLDGDLETGTLRDDSLTSPGTPFSAFTSIAALDMSGGGIGTVVAPSLEAAYQYSMVFAPFSDNRLVLTIVKIASIPGTAVPTPEPASIALLAAGGIILLGVSRRRRG